MKIRVVAFVGIADQTVLIFVNIDRVTRSVFLTHPIHVLCGGNTKGFEQTFLTLSLMKVEEPDRLIFCVKIGKVQVGLHNMVPTFVHPCRPFGFQHVRQSVFSVRVHV